MKKLLGILVLGLLWCNVGIAAKYSKVKLGMGKVDYCNIFIWSMKNTCYPSHVVYAKDNIEIHKAYNKLHIFQNVSRYIVKAKWGGVKKRNHGEVLVHTCSLDHPNALLNYISRGVKVFKKEVIKI
jgi:hypothetical protein